MDKRERERGDEELPQKRSKGEDVKLSSEARVRFGKIFAQWRRELDSKERGDLIQSLRNNKHQIVTGTAKTVEGAHFLLVPSGELVSLIQDPTLAKHSFDHCSQFHFFPGTKLGAVGKRTERSFPFAAFCFVEADQGVLFDDCKVESNMAARIFHHVQFLTSALQQSLGFVTTSYIMSSPLSWAQLCSLPDVSGIDSIPLFHELGELLHIVVKSAKCLGTLPKCANKIVGQLACSSLFVFHSPSWPRDDFGLFRMILRGVREDKTLNCDSKVIEGCAAASATMFRVHGDHLSQQCKEEIFLLFEQLDAPRKADDGILLSLPQETIESMEAVKQLSSKQKEARAILQNPKSKRQRILQATKDFLESELFLPICQRLSSEQSAQDNSSQVRTLDGLRECQILQNRTFSSTCPTSLPLLSDFGPAFLLTFTSIDGCNLLILLRERATILTIACLKIRVGEKTFSFWVLISVEASVSLPMQAGSCQFVVHVVADQDMLAGIIEASSLLHGEVDGHMLVDLQTDSDAVVAAIRHIRLCQTEYSAPHFFNDHYLSATALRSIQSVAVGQPVTQTASFLSNSDRELLRRSIEVADKQHKLDSLQLEALVTLISVPQRLVEGVVGSGKSVLAVAAADALVNFRSHQNKTALEASVTNMLRLKQESSEAHALEILLPTIEEQFEEAERYCQLLHKAMPGLVVFPSEESLSILGNRVVSLDAILSTARKKAFSAPAARCLSIMLGRIASELALVEEGMSAACTDTGTLCGCLTAEQQSEDGAETFFDFLTQVEPDDAEISMLFEEAVCLRPAKQPREIEEIDFDAAVRLERQSLSEFSESEKRIYVAHLQVKIQEKLHERAKELKSGFRELCALMEDVVNSVSLVFCQQFRMLAATPSTICRHSYFLQLMKPTALIVDGYDKIPFWSSFCLPPLHTEAFALLTVSEETPIVLLVPQAVTSWTHHLIDDCRSARRVLRLGEGRRFKNAEVAEVAAAVCGVPTAGVASDSALQHDLPAFAVNVFVWTHSASAEKLVAQEAKMVSQIQGCLQKISAVAIVPTRAAQVHFNDICPGLNVATLEAVQHTSFEVVIISMGSATTQDAWWLETPGWLWSAITRATRGVFVVTSVGLAAMFPPLQRFGEVVRRNVASKQVIPLPPPQKVIFPAIPMACPGHPKAKYHFLVTPADEVERLAAAPCSMICLQRYTGCTQQAHACLLPCHVDEWQGHHRCPFPCAKVHSCGHPCLKACSDSCGECSFVGLCELPCGQRVICGFEGQEPAYRLFHHFQLVKCGESPGPCVEIVRRPCPECGAELSVPCFSSGQSATCSACELIAEKVRQDLGATSNTLSPVLAEISKRKQLALAKSALVAKRIALGIAKNGVESYLPYAQEEKRESDQRKEKERLETEFATKAAKRNEEWMEKMRECFNTQQRINDEFQTFAKYANSQLQKAVAHQLEVLSFL